MTHTKGLDKKDWKGWLIVWKIEKCWIEKNEHFQNIKDCKIINMKDWKMVNMKDWKLWMG